MTASNFEVMRKFREVVLKIRHRFVHGRENQNGQKSIPALPQIAEVRLGIVRERIGETRPRVDEAGQVSCETKIPADIFRPKVLADTKPQAFVPGAKNQAQNVANTTYELTVFQRGMGFLNGEPLIEWHEIKSDFQ